MNNFVQDLFSRRLKRLRDRNGITMVELADAIGMSQATISEWEKGNKFPRAGALQQLANYFDVPMEYFFKENSFPIAKTVSIRCLPSIAASVHSYTDGIDCDEIEFIKLPASFLGKYAQDENLIAFKVIGESMNLLFPDSSPLVAIKIEQDEIKDGDIAVYCIDSEYAVRRYIKNEQQEVIVLSPESTNKNFYDCVVPYKTHNDFEIIAKVVWYGVSL